MATLSLKGGDRLQKYLDDLAKKVTGGGTMRAGFLENATYPDGTTVATVAAIQNFGAPAVNIPPRPFFSNVVARKSPEWGTLLARQLERNDWDAYKSLEQMGLYVAGQIRESIVETIQPPLSPITLMLRKMKDDDPELVVTGETVGEAADRVEAGLPGATGTRAKPLVDTGHMLASVDSEVVDSG